MHCTLCNEWIEQTELEFGDAFVVDEEYWHKECFQEYFDETELPESDHVLEEV